MVIFPLLPENEKHFPIELSSDNAIVGGWLIFPNPSKREIGSNDFLVKGGDVRSNIGTVPVAREA